MSGDPILRAEDVSVHYPPSRAHRDWLGRGLPVRAVDGVNLEIRPAEILAVVGESGSGKTTLARAVLRLVDITSGHIWHGGSDISHLGGARLRHLRSTFQVVFQDPYESLNPRQTVGEIVAEPLVIHGIGDPSERRAKVLSALDSVGLLPPDEMVARYPHQLSGGQRQRVAFAAAMVLEPDLVVADEPVSMLDVSLRAGILRLMLDLRERRGFACLFITHDLSLAWVVADRIAVMYLGRIVETGPADEVIRHPRHPYTRALVSVIPVPDPAAVSEQLVLEGETPAPDRIPGGCRFHPRCWLRGQLGNPERCLREDPVLAVVEGAPHHTVACHFATSDPGLAGTEPATAGPFPSTMEDVAP